MTDMRSERLVEMGSDRVEYEDLAAQERDFLAHIGSSCPEVAVDVVWVSDPVVVREETEKTVDEHESDADDRDFLRLASETDRRAAAAARPAGALFALGDLAAGAVVASLVSIAISLTRPGAFTPVLIAIAVGSFLSAVVLVAAGRSMVMLSSYVELRTCDIQRRSLE